MAASTKQQNTKTPILPVRPQAEIIAAAVARVHARIPGRDLVVFLLLLASVDITGVLHVYGLSGLYSEETFFGLGLLFVLFAVGLLAYRDLEVTSIPGAMPRQSLPLWQRMRRQSWMGVGLLTAAWALQQLLAAVAKATASSPDGKASTGVISGQQMLLLVGLVTSALLAFTIAYSPGEPIRRRWIVLLSAGWFGYSATSLQFRLVGGPPGADWYAQAGSLTTLALFILGAVAIVGIVRPFNPSTFLALAVIVGVFLRLIAFADVPVVMNRQMADMLPLVDSASTRMLEGLSPYHIYQMPYELPLTYWPLTFLLYVPFKALNQDLRTANLLFGIGTAVVLWILHRRAGGPRPGWSIYAFGLLYLTPSMFQWDLVSAAPPFWLWLSLLFAIVVWDPAPVEQVRQWPDGTFEYHYMSWLDRLKEVLPGELLGAAFAAGPLVLPFAPFIVIRWLKRGWRYALKQLIAAAIVGALVVIPFMLWDFGSFWLGTVDWFNDVNKLPMMQWNQDKSWLYEIGLAGQAYKLYIAGGLRFLQAAILIGMVGAAWDRIRTPSDVLRWGSAAYVLFIVFNTVIWPYLYTPALLGLIFTLAARERELGLETVLLPPPAPTPLPTQPLATPKPFGGKISELPPNY